MSNDDDHDLPITSFHSIFDEKLTQLRNRLKKLLEKPKKERDKKSIKLLLQEAKQLNKVLKKHKKKNKLICPCCKYEIIKD